MPHGHATGDDVAALPRAVAGEGNCSFRLHPKGIGWFELALRLHTCRGMSNQISSIELERVTGGAQWVKCKDGTYSKVPNSDVPPGAEDFARVPARRGFQGMCSYHGGISGLPIDPKPWW